MIKLEFMFFLSNCSDINCLTFYTFLLHFSLVNRKPDSKRFAINLVSKSRCSDTKLGSGLCATCVRAQIAYPAERGTHLLPRPSGAAVRVPPVKEHLRVGSLKILFTLFLTNMAGPLVRRAAV